MTLDLEDRLRTLGAATATVTRTPDAEAWEAVRERLGDDGTTVVTLSPARFRRESGRNRFVAAAAVGMAAALVGGVLLVSRHGNGDASGLAVATAADPLPRLLLDPVPDGFTLGTAFDELPNGDTDAHLILLRSTSSPAVDVGVQVSAGGNPSVDGAGVTPVTVQDHPGFLQTTDATNTRLIWGDGVVNLEVAVVGADGATVAQDVAARLVRNGPGPADVALSSVPPGFTVRFTGPLNRITARGGYQVTYESEAGPTVLLRVGRAGMPVADLAALGSFGPVTIDGRSAYLGAGSSPVGPAAPDDPYLSVLIDLGDVVVFLSADGLTRPQVLDLAAHLRALDDATWRARLGDSLQVVGSGGPATSAPLPTTTIAGP